MRWLLNTATVAPSAASARKAVWYPAGCIKQEPEKYGPTKAAERRHGVGESETTSGTCFLKEPHEFLHCGPHGSKSCVPLTFMEHAYHSPA